MALVHISNTLGTAIFPIIEDPNTSTNRIFLSGIAHDSTYLTPQFGSYFHLQPQTLIAAALPLSGIGSTGAANYSGALRLNGASISANHANSDQVSTDRSVHDAFHRSLDPVNYPARQSWYTTITNRVIMQTTYSSESPAAGSSGLYNYIFGSDITQGYYQSNASASNGSGYPNNYFYEDTTVSTASNRFPRLWGINSNSPPSEGINFHVNYDNLVTAPTLTSVKTNINQTGFFMGVDSQQNTYWCTVQDNINGEPYAISRYSWAGTATVNLTTATAVFAYVPQAATYYHRRPSNIRSDSATKKVFYSSHFDVNGNLAPVRFVWDPTNVAGTGASIPPPVTTSTCTMIYIPGSGINAVNSYTYYAASYAQTGVSSNNAESFHIQPWQFSPAGTNNWYITFFITDKSNITTNALTRWATKPQRTMMTYQIGSTSTGFDNTLTLHSSFSFEDAFNIPRDWLPVNADGTIMAMPTYTKTRFMRFSTTSGWYVSSTYPYQLETVGLDQQNRLWGVGREVGNYSVHLLTSSLPTQVSVVMPGQNYVYTGTNILTTASLYAYNWGGDLVTATVYLTIQGNSMVFTDNGTTSQTYTTSATTGTNVNLTITGAGVSNVTVGAAI
jgi:hypothetical protein